METQPSPLYEKITTLNVLSGVDTSRPFRSVKEAVAIFGERILASDIYSQKPYTIPNHEKTRKAFLPLMSMPPPSSSSNTMQAKDEELSLPFAKTLKKLEAELEETKRELEILKEKESETEIALASLNAELHKNMSKMAEAEATAAARAIVTRPLGIEGGYREGSGINEEERKKDIIVRMEHSPTLAQILSLGEQEGYFKSQKKQRKMMKKKPIIPLVGDILFSRKKSSSSTLDNPLYTSSQVYFG